MTITSKGGDFQVALLICNEREIKQHNYIDCFIIYHHTIAAYTILIYGYIVVSEGERTCHILT